MYLYFSKILNAVLVMKHFSIVVRQVSKRSSSITAYNRRELTSSTLQYKNNVVSLFPRLHESSTGEDANFLPRTCNFSFNLLAQYHAGSHQVGIFKTLFYKILLLKTLKSQPATGVGAQLTVNWLSLKSLQPYSCQHRSVKTLN